MPLRALNRFVSSSSIVTSASVTDNGKSFIEMVNKSGPRIELCDTPQVLFHVDNTIPYFLSVKLALNV